MFVTAVIKKEYTIDGELVDASLLDDMAKYYSIDFENFVERVGVRVTGFGVYNSEFGEVWFPTFAEFTRWLHRNRVDYVIVYDGVDYFCALDFAIHDDPREFKRVSIETQKGENGRYKKVTGNCFKELSGELGQRYTYSIWTEERGTRAEGGDRHARTRGTDFYAFANIIDGGVQKACEGVGAVYDGDLKGLYNAVCAFSEMCVKYTGFPYLLDKKTAFITAGSLAKRELLRSMYGSDNDGQNKKEFKKNHPITIPQDEYFRHVFLMRGGICFINDEIVNEAINGSIYRYDANSEYLYVAREMPDLGRIMRVKPQEFFKRESGCTYIVVFRQLRMRLKSGYPAVFQNPITKECNKNIQFDYEIAFFDFEIDALQEFYNFGECDINAVFRCRHNDNDGYKKFADKWYGLKEEGRRVGNEPLASFAKIFINSAIGKLAQRPDFPECEHVYNNFTHVFDLIKRKKEPDEKGLLSVAQGAMVTALGRVYIMRRILEICGKKRPADRLVYVDTDSVHATVKAPHAIVDPLELGKMKFEGEATESKYICKKVYYNIVERPQRRVVVHARGIPIKSICDAVRDNYGVEKVEDAPNDAFSRVFSLATLFDVPQSTRVEGGRVTLYVRRPILDNDIIKGENGKKYAVNVSAKNIVEEI